MCIRDSITVTRAGVESHMDSSYALRGYNIAQWESLIERSPFTIAAVTDSEGDPITPHEPGYSVFILRPRR